MAAASLALAVGLASAARAQSIVTNYLDFSDYAGIQGVALDQQTLTNMPAGITATWGWQFILVDDFSSTLPPSGSTEGFDCRGGSVVTFSSPVVIWSLGAWRWQGDPNQKIVAKLAGNIVWVYNNSGPDNVWVTVTNGAYEPIDSLEFDVADWNTRYTDVYLSDATGITPPPPPLITTFDVTPNAQWRVPGATVQLTWQVDHNATITLDNGIGDVTGYTAGGMGSYTISPTNTTTYTITSQDDTNVATAQVTVKGSVLPSNIGFLTFENIDPTAAFDPHYTWNAPDGVYLNWTGWGATASYVGSPQTPVDVFPLQWPLSSTNSLGLTNNATLLFTDSTGSTPVPVMLNSLAVNLQQLSWATNDPSAGGWGHCVIEGRLGGAVQWTWDEVTEGHDWENFVSKGAGIPIDELDVSGQWYQMDNFALATTNFPAPVLESPSAQNGQLQFSWKSVTDWASYAVMENSGLSENGWSRVGAQPPSSMGSTNSFSGAISGTPGFYRVLRVP